MSDLDTFGPNTTAKAKLISNLCKVATIDLGNQGDTLYIAFHSLGSGSLVQTIETYVIRCHKFAGRFIIQDKPTFDAEFTPGEHLVPLTDEDLKLVRKVRMIMLTAAEKVWK